MVIGRAAKDDSTRGVGNMLRLWGYVSAKLIGDYLAFNQAWHAGLMGWHGHLSVVDANELRWTWLAWEWLMIEVIVPKGVYLGNAPQDELTLLLFCHV